MSNENNSEKKKENVFLKMIKDGFQNFQETLKEQSKKNVLDWEKSKERVDRFFLKLSENWNKQVKEWGGGIEKIHEQNKEQWEASKQRIKEDIEKWQENARKDWKDGVKQWNRGWIKGAWVFMIVMIPVLVVLFIIAYIFTMVIRSIP